MQPKDHPFGSSALILFHHPVHMHSFVTFFSLSDSRTRHHHMLDNVRVNAQLIHRPMRTTNQLNKNPNIV